MIAFRRMSVRYDGAVSPTLRDVDITIEEGQLALVIAPTGAGKSTLLGTINGLVPHFTGGHLTGEVLVDGRSTADHKPRDLAHVVGVVGQDPLAGFVTDTVEEELAYGMEQLAVAPDVMRKRVEETLDLLSIAHLRGRHLRTLSGGEQQRVAIAAALTAQPGILVLDEPTSALDQTGAEEVLAAITRIVHDIGVTAVIAEHRLERVVQYADVVLEIGDEGTVRVGPPAEIMQTSAVAPPVVHLGRVCGWDPLPLSVRDARRHATDLRRSLANAGGVSTATRQGTGEAPHLRADRLVVRHGDVVAVREVTLDLAPGEVTAVMGRNGSGKSSLLWALQGTGTLTSGTVDFVGYVGLVPQTAADLLYLTTVDDECAQSDADAGQPAGTTRRVLDSLVAGVGGDQHPRDLSEGQRLALVLAIQLAPAPQAVLLDEPTRGLDYAAKGHLAALLRRLADEGRIVVFATHDVEFVASATDRVLVLADGELVADGPTSEVVVASPTLAPQVARILHPDPWLTVADVEAAL